MANSIGKISQVIGAVVDVVWCGARRHLRRAEQLSVIMARVSGSCAVWSWAGLKLRSSGRQSVVGATSGVEDSGFEGHDPFCQSVAGAEAR